jgi:apolipoprotein N-acyltransferase
MFSVARWRDYFVALSGWRRRAAAFIFGGLAVLALPPFHFVPALIPAFVGLSWLIDGSRPSSRPRTRIRWLAWYAGGGPGRDAYRCGWWFGAGFFLFGLYWISNALLVDAARYGWLIPFALAGIAGMFAIYIGLAALATFALSRQGPGRLIMLALWWAAFEWLRGWLFTGFPWNLMGTVWVFSDAMIQFTAVAGVFGLSLVTVMAAVTPAVFGMAGVSRGHKYWLVGVPFAVLAMLWAGGTWRLADASDAMVDGVQLRLVQPNIAQADKWKRNLRARHLQNLLALSQGEGAAAPTHIIWPETAVPLFLQSASRTAHTIAGVVPAGGALLTGAPRYMGRAAGGPFLWNSLHIVDAGAKLQATYDKHHLVPFGEYVPFKSILPIAKFTQGRTDFSAGPGLRSLFVPGAPRISPLICFEALFPGQVVAPGGERPGWLLNITNDAWFGNSPGPYQHFAAVRLRAAEEGIPLVRVANTGISAVVDAYGRTLVQTRLDERIAIDSALPKTLSSKTIFSLIGNLVIIFIALLYVILLFGFPYLYNRRQLR